MLSKNNVDYNITILSKNSLRVSCDNNISSKNDINYNNRMLSKNNTGYNNKILSKNSLCVSYDSIMLLKNNINYDNTLLFKCLLRK